jgi:hypothetical protein
LLMESLNLFHAPILNLLNACHSHSSKICKIKRFASFVTKVLIISYLFSSPAQSLLGKSSDVMGMTGSFAFVMFLFPYADMLYCRSHFNQGCRRSVVLFSLLVDYEYKYYKSITFWQLIHSCTEY